MPPTIYTVTLNPGLDRTLTVQRIEYNDVLRASESRLDWGGKGFNVSRALQALDIETLGVNCRALGFVGGAVGSMLEEGLHSAGIATRFIHIDGETRTNTVIEEASSSRYIKVNEAGPTIREESIAQLFRQVEELASSGTIWVLAGSLPPGVPADTYARLIALLESSGARTILDTSGAPLRHGCAAGPTMVKPNAEEAEELTGNPVQTIEDAVEAARAVQELGAQNVSLSLGADGLLLASADRCVHVHPPRVEVKTVVGVGDALVAGLVYALVLEKEWDDMARWGVAAGTGAAIGAGTSVADLHTVTSLYEQVVVERLQN